MGYRVMELGAAGDGKTNDAHVIQKAIDLCSEQGGGVVIYGRRSHLSFRFNRIKKSCRTGGRNRGCT